MGEKNIIFSSFIFIVYRFGNIDNFKLSTLHSKMELMISKLNNKQSSKAF